jgi:ribonuclease P protein component
MKKEQRLRRRSDFSAAYRRGRVQGNQLLVVRVLPNQLEVARFGFAVSKVVGGAVVRNRVKRRLREIARQLPVRPGVDVVVGARKAAAGASSVELREAMTRLMRRSDVLDAATAEGSK